MKSTFGVVYVALTGKNCRSLQSFSCFWVFQKEENMGKLITKMMLSRLFSLTVAMLSHIIRYAILRIDKRHIQSNRSQLKYTHLQTQLEIKFHGCLDQSEFLLCFYWTNQKQLTKYCFFPNRLILIICQVRPNYSSTFGYDLAHYKRCGKG